RGILNPSAALRFQQQRNEIMNRVSQLVNNFLNDFVATAGLNFCTAEARYRRTPTALLPSSHAVFPLARKRRDSKHPPPSMQALCEESLKKPPCTHAHGGF
ncbi:hypothetical protein KDW78_25745, partial [Burkholderia cenocepacia]|uniref:hypothetical protein n=2 Tax=Burkholderia cenocepacia TaxID=95486 RepID=UPI001B9D5EE1